MVDLAAEIAKALQEYTDEVVEDLDRIGDEVAKEGLEMVKGLAPVGKRGKYNRSFKIRKGKLKKTLHNTEYQLTHLLEKGHMNRDGSRTRAIPHWQQAEEFINKEYEKRVKERLKNGH